MLEAYEAFADYRDIMDLIEGVFIGVAEKVTGGTTITYQGRDLHLGGPYRRASQAELVSERLGAEVSLDTPLSDLQGLARDNGVEFEEDWSVAVLLNEIYEELVEGALWEPTFVTHQPIEVSPLSRRNQDDPRLAAAEESWSTCMADAGYDFAAEEDVERYLMEKLAELEETANLGTLVLTVAFERDVQPLVDEELAIAAADLACRADLDRIRADLTREYEGAFIADHREQLEEIRELDRQFMEPILEGWQW